MDLGLEAAPSRRDSPRPAASRDLEVDDPPRAAYPQGYRPPRLKQASITGGFRSPDNVRLDREAMAAAREHLARVVRDREVSIRISSGAFANLLLDGRYKTLPETGSSLAPVPISERVDAETDIFGYPPSLEPRLRPVYGYLAHPGGDPAGSILDVFGRNIRIVLREGVRQRSTVTVGDSLAGRQIGAWLPAVEAASPDYALTRMCASEYVARAGEPDGEYIEVQIHGQGRPAVTTDDIAYVEFIGKEPSALQQQMMKGRGLRWTVAERRYPVSASGPRDTTQSEQHAVRLGR